MVSVTVQEHAKPGTVHEQTLAMLRPTAWYRSQKTTLPGVAATPSISTQTSTPALELTVCLPPPEVAVTVVKVHNAHSRDTEANTEPTLDVLSASGASRILTTGP